MGRVVSVPGRAGFRADVPQASRGLGLVMVPVCSGTFIPGQSLTLLFISPCLVVCETGLPIFPGYIYVHIYSCTYNYYIYI